MADAFDYEEITIDNINQIVKSNNNTQTITTMLTNYYLNLTTGNKADYADVILFWIYHCKYYWTNTDTDFVTSFLTFIRESYILENCNIGTIERLLSDTYRLDRIYLYAEIINVINNSENSIHIKFDKCIKDHLESFYTHPKYSELTKFIEISHLLTNEQILFLFEKVLIRNVEDFILHFIHNRKKFGIQMDTKVSSTLQKYVEIYTTYVVIFENEIKYLYKDINQVIFDYLF